MSTSTRTLLTALCAVDAAGAAIAARHRVAAEPFGIGGSLDVRDPMVVTFWGTGLSAPMASLLLAAVLRGRWPTALRLLSGLFAVGALSEPAFWGRRRCPRTGRLLVFAHVALAAKLAATAPPTRSGE